MALKLNESDAQRLRDNPDIEIHTFLIINPGPCWKWHGC